MTAVYAAIGTLFTSTGMVSVIIGSMMGTDVTNMGTLTTMAIGRFTVHILVTQLTITDILST